MRIIRDKNCKHYKKKDVQTGSQKLARRRYVRRRKLNRIQKTKKKGEKINTIQKCTFRKINKLEHKKN